MMLPGKTNCRLFLSHNSQFSVAKVNNLLCTMLFSLKEWNLCHLAFKADQEFASTQGGKARFFSCYTYRLLHNDAATY